MKKAIITLSILCGGLLIATPANNNIFAQGTNTETKSNEIVKVQYINNLNQNEAKELLQKRNPNVEYIYQGDETTFESLKEKGLSGFVFLPDVDGDLGMFVDKDSAKVYYFHPSGYLELAL